MLTASQQSSVVKQEQHARPHALALTYCVGQDHSCRSDECEAERGMQKSKKSEFPLSVTGRRNSTDLMNSRAVDSGYRLDFDAS